jgi:IS30 family transposase
MKLYKQLTKNERFFVDYCFNIQHLTMRSIAKMLGKNPSTISREIKRNSTNEIYFYQTAHVKKNNRS